MGLPLLGKAPLLRGKVPQATYPALTTQEKLDGYLQFMKGEIERQAKFNPDRFDDSLSELHVQAINHSVSFL